MDQTNPLILYTMLPRVFHPNLLETVQTKDVGCKKISNFSVGPSLLQGSSAAMTLLLCLLPSLLLLHLVAGHSQPRPQVQEEGGQDRKDSHVTKTRLKQVLILHLTLYILYLSSHS